MKIIILLLVALALGQCIQGNTEQCQKLASEIAGLSAQVAADVKTSNFAQQKKDFEKLESLLNQTKEECGQIQEKVTAAPTCISDVQKILSLAEQSVVNMKTLKFAQLKTDVVDMKGLLVQATEDCLGELMFGWGQGWGWGFEGWGFEGNSFDQVKCLEDTLVLVKLIPQLQNDMKTKAWGQLIKDVQAVAPSLVESMKYCER